MAFDFPASPAAGQEFTPAGGPTYVWQPPIWKMKAASGGTGGEADHIALGDWTYSATTTVPPASGEFRYNTTDQFEVANIRIAEITAGGGDADILLKFSLVQGAKVLIQSKTDVNKYKVYLIIGPVVDAGAYFDVPVVIWQGGSHLTAGTLHSISVLPLQGPPVLVLDVPYNRPIPGQLWWESDTGILYIWYDDGNSQQWVQVSGVGDTSAVSEAPLDGKTYGRVNGAWADITQSLLNGKYLPITGGELTGDLDIRTLSPELRLKGTTPTETAYVQYYANDKLRWNLGMDQSQYFGLGRFDASGNFIDTPLLIDPNNGATVFQGAFVVNRSQPVLGLNRPNALSPAQIASQIGYTDRWILSLGTAEAEGSGNSGNNFELAAYSNTGAYIGSPIKITRSDMFANFGGGVGMDGKLWARQGAEVNGAALTVKNFHGIVAADTNAAGGNSGLWMYDRANPRWALYKHGGAESGSDAGSDLRLDRTSDAGVTSNILVVSRATGTITLGVGQLKFPATANPSSDVNTLDDYREGSFVPAFLATGSTFNYQSRFGYYTKVGQLVFVNLQLKLAATGNTLTANTLTITGLPFTAINGSSIASINWWQTSTGYANMAARISGTQLEVFGIAAAAVANMASVTADKLSATAGSQFDMTFCYQAS